MNPPCSRVRSVGRLQSQFVVSWLNQLMRVLTPGEPVVVGSHVLEEQELAARSEHASDLADGAWLVVDTAENQRRHDGVEAAVVIGEILGWCAQDGGRHRCVSRGAFESAHHGGIRFGESEGADRAGIVREVEAGAGADLEDGTVGVGQQLGACGG